MQFLRYEIKETNELILAFRQCEKIKKNKKFGTVTDYKISYFIIMSQLSYNFPPSFSFFFFSWLLNILYMAGVIILRCYSTFSIFAS